MKGEQVQSSKGYPCGVSVPTLQYPVSTVAILEILQHKFEAEMQQVTDPTDPAGPVCAIYPHLRLPDPV